MIKLFPLLLIVLDLLSHSTANLPPKCPGPYEIFVTCKDVCPETCLTIYSATPKPACIPPSPCPSGCNCAAGYVRNSNNICVKKAQCPIPKCTGSNETFTPGENLCLQTCRTFYKLVLPPACIPSPPFPEGCKCIPGYVRNANNVCVKTSDCPPPIVCTTNEIPNLCPRSCVPGTITTCAQYLNNSPDICPANQSVNSLCVPRCDCAPNFLRNSRGVCVRSEDCCNDVNEVVTNCPDPCPLSCDNLETHDTTPCLQMCKTRGCVCRSGYVRSSNGTCITRSSCPLKCAATEIVNVCPNPCQPEGTCRTVVGNVPITCTQPSTNCTPRCECLPGLVRIGSNCVSPNQCCTNPNTEEAVDCPTDCDETCEGKPAGNCSITCIKKRCRCRSGHVRNILGQCIQVEQCPKCTDANEVYRFCGTACEANCDKLNPVCPNRPCVEGCFCKPGYVRLQRKCVPIKDCPLKCNANEVFNPCAPYCSFDDTCASLFRRLIIDCVPMPTNFVCPRRCECVQGFVRIGNNCVSPDQCCREPAVEEAVDCPVPCDETCEGVPASGCVSSDNCRKGCRCRNGLVRNSNQRCIPRNECPRCNGTNEVYRFCSCSATCTNPNGTCIGPCTEGCFCRPGYVRFNGNCILVSQCPPVCSANEVVNMCPAQCSFEEDCQSLLNPVNRNCVPTSVVLPCRPRCECRTGYIRSNGVCVPIDQCCRSPTTEQAVNCSAPCDQDCEGVLSTNCNCTNYRCGCRNGYVRNAAGICILRQNCPTCTGANEVYKICGRSCQPSCDDLNPICSNQCVEGCFCRSGFVRHQGRCIPVNECPLKCGTNEVYNPCPAYCSFDLDCARVIDGLIRDCAQPPPRPVCQRRCECLPGFVRIGSNCVSPDQCCNNPTTEEARPCPVTCDDTCGGPALANCTIRRCAMRGCHCRNGLVRDVNNLCIPSSNCPPRCNDVNEVFNTCGSNCPPTCENRNPTCTEQCVRGCFCKEGYVRHLGKCIPVRKCPPTCSTNEEVVECPAFCSFDEDCLSLVEGVVRGCTVPPPDFECIPRCFCRPGFVRIGAACVPANQCCNNSQTQDVFNCSTPCDTNCNGSPDSSCLSTPCIKNRCLCKTGYVRKSGVCVPKATCPPPCSNPNEVFKTCGTKCQPTCDDRTPVCTKDCAEGCFCKDGFIRHLGQCIPVEECPIVCTLPNEEFKACGSCDPTCDNLTPQCLPGCHRGCFCKPGFVRQNGQCIPQGSCPRVCSGLNEEFNSCGSACPATCDNRIRICPALCVPGCFCKSGYIKDNGTCIKIEDCPVACNDTNEEFTTCGTCDPTCENPTQVCRIACQRGCFCKKGYVRNNQKCILPSTCPNKCVGPNEEYKSCGSACPPTCEKRISTCYVPCVGGCFCINGYIRKNGVCVKPEDCSCGVNERQSTCVPKIQASCQQRSEVPSLKCIQGCVCVSGYLRNGSKCVKREACP
ncbi:zonadhesin-like [Arctopsyche grandis]|uniref:zonadhesin-like n=1 Tax=Arctopsyche grandis TaxID=121162 RepID=UPI00406D7FE3